MWQVNNLTSVLELTLVNRRVFVTLFVLGES